jgi:hypothetical protein
LPTHAQGISEKTGFVQHRLPLKTKPAAEGRTAPPSIPDELLEHFVKGSMTAEAVQAAFAFKRAPIERALGAEPGRHPVYAPEAERPEVTTTQRNGKSARTVLTYALIFGLHIGAYLARKIIQRLG